MATWTVHVEDGPKRVNHAAACINGLIYSFGGYCTGEDFGRRRDIDIHVFNTYTYKWRKLPHNGLPQDIPYQRYGHTAVAYNQCCYIFGGRNDVDGVSEYLYEFNVETCTWRRPLVSGQIPLSRDGHTSCIINNIMYIFGGYEEHATQFSKTVYALNLDTFVWRFCPVTGEAPEWRDFHSATRWGDYMIVFGGRCDEHAPILSGKEFYPNDIYMFDPLAQHWTRPEVTGAIPKGRRSHNAFEYQGRIYIFGGYNGNIKEHFNDIHVYDPEKRVWSLCKPCGQSPSIRRRACCCVSDGKVFIFGGTSPKKQGSNKLQDLSDMHTLDLAPSLKTLCMMAVVKQGIAYDCLPRTIITVIAAMRQSHSG